MTGLDFKCVYLRNLRCVHVRAEGRGGTEVAGNPRGLPPTARVLLIFRNRMLKGMIKLELILMMSSHGIFVGGGLSLFS